MKDEDSGMYHIDPKDHSATPLPDSTTQHRLPRPQRQFRRAAKEDTDILQDRHLLAEGKNTLIHCSDGWDRTSQLCSLTGIILDPYYRTMEGFQVLIEKDWVRFGHQFYTRMGQGVNNPNGEEKSPVFLQFLDCTSQLLYQYPSDF